MEEIVTASLIVPSSDDEGRGALGSDNDSPRHDSLDEVAGELMFEATARRSGLEREIRDVQLGPTADVATRNKYLKELRREDAALKEEQNAILVAVPTEHGATLMRILRRWEERAERGADLDSEWSAQEIRLKIASVEAMCVDLTKDSKDVSGNVFDRRAGRAEALPVRGRGDSIEAERNQTGPRHEARSSSDARSQSLELRIERWAERMRRSREWISFADIADWCAREKGSIRADETLRTETYRALGESVASGEFEERGRSRVVYQTALLLPSHPVRIRMTRELYEACPDPNRDNLPWCWMPHDMASRWLEGKRLPLPHWLTGSAIVAAPAKTSKPGDGKLPPFNPKQAKGLLLGQKASKAWPEAPDETVTRAFLKKHFNGVPNGPHRQVRHEVWPNQIKQGPKPKRGAAK